MSEVDYITVTGWGVWKGHAIPIPVARYIAEQVNELVRVTPVGEPIARVVNDNQPGNTAIIEVLCTPPTLAVGTELYATPGGAGVGEPREAIETAQDLIKQAKGHEGGDGGPLSNLLDFADSWLDRALEGLEVRHA